MNRRLPMLLRAAALAGAALLFGTSCTTVPEGTAQLHEVVRVVPGGDPPWQRVNDASGVRLRRGGVEQPARLGMVLEPGDVLSTGPGVAVVLRLARRGEAALDENSAVRIGSLEVLFGRLFAELRGLFAVRSETVEAVNDGTRFLFEVGPDRNVRVVVADGALTCRSRTGAWPAVRLTTARALLVYPGNQPPRVLPADPREVDGPLRAIASAPRAGWCCRVVGGPVSPGWEQRCPGPWSTSRESAEAQCRPEPPPPPTGWCCNVSAGEVMKRTRDRCIAEKGAFYMNEAQARKVCKRPER
jgi:hypothetical protein